MDKVIVVRKLLELAVIASIAFVISGIVAALVLWHQPRSEPRECAERKCFMQLQNQVSDLQQRLALVEVVCHF